MRVCERASERVGGWSDGGWVGGMLNSFLCHSVEHPQQKEETEENWSDVWPGASK